MDDTSFFWFFVILVVCLIPLLLRED